MQLFFLDWKFSFYVPTRLFSKLNLVDYTSPTFDSSDDILPS